MYRYTVWTYNNSNELYKMRMFKRSKEAIEYAANEMKDKRNHSVSISKEKNEIKIDITTLTEYNEGE